MTIELEYVQHMILFDAADLANEVIVQEDLRYRNGRRANLAGEIYRADPTRSVKGGLCLSVDPHIAEALSAWSVQRLHEIGREAMKKALVKNKQQFVGIILGEAREGRNYFDRFVEDGQQTKLF